MPFVNDMLAEINRREEEPASLASFHKAEARSAGAGPVSRFLFDPQRVMELLRSRIVGQEQALAMVEAMLKVVKADIGDPRKPLSVGLLIGPTGVGKTELVRVLAEAIHGHADAYCRIDMNTLAQDHYAAAITGAPPGYVGSKEGTTLLDADLIQGSFSRPGIVLFDEIEKAGQQVIRSLLNLLDNGRLTLTSGAKTIDFRNCLVFMTSNLGAQAIHRYEQNLQRPWRKYLQPTAAVRRKRVQQILDQALQQAFDPEFINRIDQIIRFNWIESNVLNALVDLELTRLNARLAKLGVHIGLNRDARDWLQQGFDRRFGARSMSRAFRQQVALGVADALQDRALLEALSNADTSDRLTLMGELEQQKTGLKTAEPGVSGQKRIRFRPLAAQAQ